MKKLVASLLGVLVLFSVVLIVASEAGEVVVIRSTSDGETLETRIWVIDAADGLLVRGTDSKAWVLAARQAGEVELERDGIARRYHVIEQTGADARRRINDLMRAKYGLADRMIGWLRDYDSTVSLKLKLIEAPPPPIVTPGD
jgi:hypothetical protein